MKRRHSQCRSRIFGRRNGSGIIFSCVFVLQALDRPCSLADEADVFGVLERPG